MVPRLCARTNVVGKRARARALESPVSDYVVSAMRKLRCARTREYPALVSPSISPSGNRVRPSKFLISHDRPPVYLPTAKLNGTEARGGLRSAVFPSAPHRTAARSPGYSYYKLMSRCRDVREGRLAYTKIFPRGNSPAIRT